MTRLWMPDWPPASADDKDDEFADSSFDTGAWTEWDQPGKLTVSEAAYGLSLLQVTNAGDNLTGIFRAVPAGDWAIWTKVSLSGTLINFQDVGLVLGQDLTNNPATSDIVTFLLRYQNGAMGFYVFLWNAYNSFNSQLFGLSDVLSTTHAYLRIRKASTNFSFDWSSDGIGWQQLYSNTISFTPAEFGLCTENGNAGTTMHAIAQFFRCVDGTPALTDVMGGQRVL